MPDVLTKTLWDGRRALAGFAAGTALVGAAYAGFYPQVSDGAMGQTVQGFSPALREALRMEDLASAAGYLGSSVFGIIVPLIAVIFGIATGTRAIAGDEEAGYLDLLLAHPVSRTRLLLHRFAALTAGATLVAAVVLLAMLAVRPGARLDSISIGQFTAQCLALALLIIVFGAVAVTIGAATGSRAAALAGTAAIAVLTYAASTAATQINADALRYASPFHYYIGGEPLRHGFQWADLSILTATTAVLLTIAVLAFNRRDLTT
ncbi:ABC transporter permease subunit [Micromonospora sp. WMMD998]|uniref:ABC transporter permease subunit n=1 Tax=Micromonospora sp. WMMD998 TaxID=3016092 RepID=UPI00249A58B9|nr:ABC transporter permease subunit [Micromonospora sp. WMMD998]WFE37368.1 ABC transporter permease subunit [Micromonospora sp. WMMD998]